MERSTGRCRDARARDDNRERYGIFRAWHGPS
jgi:hypothetical protein